MAGNNLIQILRGEGKSSTAKLLDGQPYFDKSNNILRVGNGDSTSIQDTLPINANLYLEEFWTGVASGKSQVRVGDKLFVPVDGCSVPVTCVDVQPGSNSDSLYSATFMMNWPSNIAIPGLFPSGRFDLDDQSSWWNSCYYYLLNGGSVQGNMSSMNFDSICIFKKLPSYLQDIITPYSLGSPDASTSAKLWTPRLEHIVDRSYLLDGSLGNGILIKSHFTSSSTEYNGWNINSNITQFKYFHRMLYISDKPAPTAQHKSNMTVFLASCFGDSTSTSSPSARNTNWVIWRGDGIFTSVKTIDRDKYACAICFTIDIKGAR